MTDPIPQDAVMAEVSRLGLRWTDIEFCPVSQMPDGRVIYRRRRQRSHADRPSGGVLVQWTPRPIQAARACEDSFIGYLFETGVMRTDAEILFEGFCKVVLPRYACFYRQNVAASERLCLACHPREAGSAKRPTVVIP